MSVRQEPDIEAAAWEETEEEVREGWVWFDNEGESTTSSLGSALAYDNRTKCVSLMIAHVVGLTGRWVCTRSSSCSYKPLTFWPPL